MTALFDVSRWRPGPLLPPRDARDGALVFVVAVLCFLACLTAFAALAEWRSRMMGPAPPRPPRPTPRPATTPKPGS